MGAEVVGGLAIGAEIDGSSGLGMVMINSIDRTNRNRRGKIAAIGEGEEKIHVLEAARAIGLGANLADSVALESVAVGAAVAPLVALLDSDERVTAPVRAYLEVVEVGRDWAHVREPVAVGAGGF
jgi:hypothetical protein